MRPTQVKSGGICRVTWINISTVGSQFKLKFVESVDVLLLCDNVLSQIN